MEFPENLILSLSDACPPAPWADALITRRALFECNELARLSPDLRPSNLKRPGGASMVLATFAETKGPRLPGPKPGISRYPNERKVEAACNMEFPEDITLSRRLPPGP